VVSNVVTVYCAKFLVTNFEVLCLDGSVTVLLMSMGPSAIPYMSWIDSKTL